MLLAYEAQSFKEREVFEKEKFSRNQDLVGVQSAQPPPAKSPGPEDVRSVLCFYAELEESEDTFNAVQKDLYQFGDERLVQSYHACGEVSQSHAAFYSHYAFLATRTGRLSISKTAYDVSFFFASHERPSQT